MPTIKKDDVTAKRICQVLNAAAIESSLDDDGDIYAKKGGIDFGLWLKFPADKTLVKLFTYAQCKENTSLEAIQKFATKLNSEYLFVKFTVSQYEDGRTYLNGEYDYLFPFGMISENLIASVKMFSSIFITSIQDEDSNDEFFA